MNILHGRIKLIIISAVTVAALTVGALAYKNHTKASENSVVQDEVLKAEENPGGELGKGSSSDIKISENIAEKEINAEKELKAENEPDAENELDAEIELNTEQEFDAGQDEIADTTGENPDESFEDGKEALCEDENEDDSNSYEIPLGDDDERYMFITGDVKKKYYIDHMPAGYRYDSEAKERMTTITVPVWKMNDDRTRRSSEMQLTVNSLLAEDVKSIFDEIYALDIQFPIRYLSGYGYRKVGGVGLVDSTLMSAHAFGVAIDINPDDYDNDYYLGKGNDLRNKNNPYCIPDEVIDIFKAHGWYWGGDFNICADTMHFQYFGLDFLEYETDNPDEPFPILQYKSENMNKAIVVNMQQRLVRLGYLDKVPKSFNKATDEAIRAFQEAEGIEADGIVDYETWERLINLTHMMEYVF